MPANPSIWSGIVKTHMKGVSRPIWISTNPPQGAPNTSCSRSTQLPSSPFLPPPVRGSTTYPGHGSRASNGQLFLQHRLQQWSKHPNENSKFMKTKEKSQPGAPMLSHPIPPPSTAFSCGINDSVFVLGKINLFRFGCAAVVNQNERKIS